MKSIFINKDTRDFEFNNLNRFELVTNKEEIKQRIWIRLGINKGEWFLNTNLGIPWHDLLDNNATPEQIRAEVQKALEHEEYIKSIDYVRIEEIDKENRKLKLSFSVVTDLGEIESTEEVAI